MTRLKRWWRRVVRPWAQKYRADRNMPAPIGRWMPGVPITIWAHPSLPLGHRVALRRAVLWWQERLGKVFYLEPMDSTTETAYAVRGYAPMRSAVVLAEEPVRQSAATTESQVRRGELVSAEVRLRSDLRGTRLFRACVHELGHVLGLGDNHGGDESLLMTPDKMAKGCELLPEELTWLSRQWVR